MSIRKTIKLMEDVRDFADEGLDTAELRNLSKEYGEAIKGRLIDGLLGGYDTEGKQFKGLAESTLYNRLHREDIPTTSNRPLIDKNQSILNFLKSPDLIKAGSKRIQLKPLSSSSVPYINQEPDHNTGFTTPKGGNVPARKWYGIPKTYREGGTKYNEFLKKFVKRIEENFKKVLKFR